MSTGDSGINRGKNPLCVQAIKPIGKGWTDHIAPWEPVKSAKSILMAFREMYGLFERFVQLQGKQTEPCWQLNPLARPYKGWGCLDVCPAVSALRGADADIVGSNTALQVRVPMKGFCLGAALMLRSAFRLSHPGAS